MHLAPNMVSVVSDPHAPGEHAVYAATDTGQDGIGVATFRGGVRGTESQTLSGLVGLTYYSACGPGQGRTG